MSERTDLPKIKPNETPTIFNHEAGKWGWIAGVGASLVALPVAVAQGVRELLPFSNYNPQLQAEKMVPIVKKMGIFILCAQVAGAVLGGLSGKAQQEREQVEGRTVKTPSYWNKGILTGLFTSAMIQAPFSFAMMNAKSLLGKTSAWPAMTLTVGSAAIGSILRKNSLQTDFDKAVAIRDQEQAQLKEMVQSIAKEKSPQQGTGFKNAVTAEEAAVLDRNQKPAASHADQQAQRAAVATDAASIA